MPILPNEERDSCDKPISQSEILKSIKEISNGRTPGSDGLPTDWYKYFWIDIKNSLTDSKIYALSNGYLSLEQKRGINTLLPKKKKNRLYLKIKWRHISLLNTDYKIIAKIIA